MTAICRGLCLLFALLALAPAPRYDLQPAPAAAAQSRR